jgi:hypothetical protein
MALVGISLNLPFSVPRYYALMTIGVVIYFAMRQRRWRVTPYVGAIMLVLGFFGSFLVNTFRNATSASEVAELVSEVQLVKTEHFYYGDLDAYEMLTYGLSYVNENGFSWGEGLLGAILFWVPRSTWPDKPVSTGHMLGEGYINIMSATANVNLSAPLVLEGMINFGILGVVGIAFISGWLSGGLAGASSRNRSLVLSDAILAPLTGLWLFILRGSLMSALAYSTGIALAAVTAMVLLFYTRKTSFSGPYVA